MVPIMETWYAMANVIQIQIQIQKCDTVGCGRRGRRTAEQDGYHKREERATFQHVAGAQWLRRASSERLPELLRCR
jgi:hypothetical protein